MVDTKREKISAKIKRKRSRMNSAVDGNGCCDNNPRTEANQPTGHELQQQPAQLHGRVGQNVDWRRVLKRLWVQRDCIPELTLFA